MHAVFGTLIEMGLIARRSCVKLIGMAGYYAGRCRFVVSNNSKLKEASCKSPDQEIKAARANRLEIKGSFFKIFNTREKNSKCLRINLIG